MREAPPQAHHQFGVFTVQQALVSGWSKDALRRAVNAERLVRIRRGVFAFPVDPKLDTYQRNDLLLGQRGVAAALMIPDAAVSHAAALAVHGLPTFQATETPCITKPQDCRTFQRDLHLHRKLLVPKMLDPRLDFAISSVARSCVDVACELGVAAGVIAADAALHAGRLTEEDLLIARCSIKGDIGSPNAGRMLDLVDGRSESPLESLSRVSMDGLVPKPMIQPYIYTPWGKFIGRVDFLWEEFGLIGEADGNKKYILDEDSMTKQKERQILLTNTNAVMARWGWDLAMRPNQLAAYLHERLDRAYSLKAAGLYPQWIVRPS